MDDAERIRRLTAERDTLRERVRQLEASMTASAPFFGLPLEPQQRKLLCLLVTREFIARDVAATILESSPESVKVQIHRMRQRLKPLGVRIHTDWGEGYYMTPEMKQKARDIAGRAAA